ncbi:MAG: hypothetical protein Kow00106_05910 [Anaerolineae bacterium]
MAIVETRRDQELKQSLGLLALPDSRGQELTVTPHPEHPQCLYAQLCFHDLRYLSALCAAIGSRRESYHSSLHVRRKPDAVSRTP